MSDLIPSQLLVSVATVSAAMLDAQNKLSAWVQANPNDSHAPTLAQHVTTVVTSLQNGVPQTTTDVNAQRWAANPLLVDAWFDAAKSLDGEISDFFKAQNLVSTITSAVTQAQQDWTGLKSAFEQSAQLAKQATLAVAQAAVDKLTQPMSREDLAKLEDSYNKAGQSLVAYRTSLIKLGILRQKSGQTLTASEVEAYNTQRRALAVSISTFAGQVNAQTDAWNGLLKDTIKSLTFGIGDLANKLPPPNKMLPNDLGDQILEGPNGIQLLPKEIVPVVYRNNAPSLTSAEVALTAGMEWAGALPAAGAAFAIGTVIMQRALLVMVFYFAYKAVTAIFAGDALKIQAQTEEHRKITEDTIALSKRDQAARDASAQRALAEQAQLVKQGVDPVKAADLAKQHNPEPAPLKETPDPVGSTDWGGIILKGALGLGMAIGVTSLLKGSSSSSSQPVLAGLPHKKMPPWMRSVPKKRVPSMKSKKMEACVRAVKAKEGARTLAEKARAKSKAFAICQVSVRKRSVRHPGGMS